MIFDVLTLFPEMFDLFNYSIISRAKENHLISINLYNIRDFSKDKHKKVDDYPYGGGAGMVMQVQPIYDAVQHVKEIYGYKPYTILTSPSGKRFNQQLAKELAGKKHIMLICGHYEGIDERVMSLVDSKISIGDFVLTGGEIPAMAIIDSTSRIVDGVLSSNESYENESFYDGLLEYPQYTRPEVFNDQKVPEILLSGHHENIRKWRRYHSLKTTYENRPDLIDFSSLNKEDKTFIKKINNEEK